MGADAYGRHATGIAGKNLDPNSEGRGVLQFKTGLMSVIKKQGGTPQQEKGAVKAVQDLYDVVQQGGILIFFYLQKIYPDEWKNFLARIGHDENALHFELFDNPTDNLELRFWASYRGQTLARTEGSDVEGAISCNDATDTRGFELSPEARAHADLKFTYVVTCQIYGKQKEGQKPEAADISIAAQAAARKAEIAAQLSAQDDEYDLTGLTNVRPSNPNANT
ncbi:hypothetical protein TB1_037308 [Malus domestica]